MEIVTENSQNSKIESIKSGAKEAEQGGAPFMQPGTKVKKPRGPYKKKGETDSKGSPAADSAPKAQQSKGPEIKTSAALKPLLTIASSAAVKWAEAPQAGMSPDELEAGAEALGGLIDKYFPNGLDKYGHEIATVLIFGQWGLRVAAVKAEVGRQKAAFYEKQKAAQTDPLTNPAPEARTVHAELVP